MRLGMAAANSLSIITLALFLWMGWIQGNVAEGDTEQENASLKKRLVYMPSSQVRRVEGLGNHQECYICIALGPLH